MTYHIQGEGILNNRPFEHAAIIGTLHDELFGGSRSILRLYPDRFKAGEEETYTLTPSMIALAATAVSLFYTRGMLLKRCTGICGPQGMGNWPSHPHALYNEYVRGNLPRPC